MTEKEIFEGNREVYIRYTQKRGKLPPNIVEIEGKRVQKLPEIVRGLCGIFSLKKRVGEWAIYQKIATREGPINYDYFEVIKLKKRDNKKDREHLNKRFNTNYNIEEEPDFRETYPTNEDFGSLAWAFRDYKSAEEKLESLLNEEKTDEMQ